jgi:tRNA dimethylallyltransferase
MHMTGWQWPQRGKVPIVAGGTGFYLRWFIYGKPRTPESTPEGAAAAQRTLDEVGRIRMHGGRTHTAWERGHGNRKLSNGGSWMRRR